MSKDFYFDVLANITRKRVMSLMLVALAAAVWNIAAPAMAEQGCEDMRQLCKDATADAAKCTKQGKDEAPPNCKPLIDVREATCAQAEIICKPASGDAQSNPAQ